MNALISTALGSRLSPAIRINRADYLPTPYHAASRQSEPPAYLTLFFCLAAGVDRASNGGGNAFGKPDLYVFN